MTYYPTSFQLHSLNDQIAPNCTDSELDLLCSQTIICNRLEEVDNSLSDVSEDYYETWFDIHLGTNSTEIRQFIRDNCFYSC